MKLALFSPNKSVYSETFILAHYEMISQEAKWYYSKPKRGYFPIYNPDGKALFSDNILVLLIEGFLDKVLGMQGSAYFMRKSALIKSLKENNIEVAMAEYGPTSVKIMDVLHEAGIPLVAHFHGRGAYHYKTLKLYKKHYSKLFKMAAKVIAVSTDMKNQLVSLGCPSEKIVVTPCGPNEYFKNESETVKDADQVLLSSGRFTAKKAPLNTIKAFELSLDKYPDAKLWMLADGPLWAEAKRYVVENNLSQNVDFLGPKKRPEIKELMHKTRAFIQHSVRSEDGDSEGTPVSILEAMSFGLPIVSTYHAGIKEVVQHEVTGLLCEENDIETMAANIRLIFGDKEFAQQLGNAGRVEVQEKYTLERHISVLRETLKSVAKKL